jgi:hypothetical protein
MKTRLVLFMFIAALSLAGLFACRAPSTQKDVVAQVGGVTITIDELLNHPATRQGLDSLISDTLILLECRERGIVLDQEKYQQSVDGLIQQQGGREKVEEFLKQNKIGWPELFRYQRIQILTSQLIEARIGEPTEEEISQYFSENEDRFRTMVANRVSVDKASVTLDDAREDIIKEIKNRKMGEAGQNLNADLKAKYAVKNYLTGEGLKPEEEPKEDEGLAGKIDLSGAGPKEPESSTEK